MDYIKPEIKIVLSERKDILTVSGETDSTGSNEGDVSDLNGAIW